MTTPESPFPVILTPAERDDLTLALRCWETDLEEPTKSRALNKTRRAKAAQVARLADYLRVADVPELARAMFPERFR